MTKKEKKKKKARLRLILKIPNLNAYYTLKQCTRRLEDWRNTYIGVVAQPFTKANDELIKLHDLRTTSHIPVFFPFLVFTLHFGLWSHVLRDMQSTFYFWSLLFLIRTVFGPVH
jgi:hypothetical protein